MLAVSAVFGLYLLASLITGHIQATVIYIYAAASAVSFVAYWLDKSASQRGTWRIQERTLHLMALLCGWPGACAAQTFLRHKTIKQPFQRIFIGSVLLNIAGLILYSSSTVSGAVLKMAGWN